MMKKGIITIQELKDIDMVSYLASMGIKPDRVHGNNYWYRSPLRNEKTPSFKINQRLQLWVDYSDHKSNGKFNGGSIIDFAMQMYKIDLGELLRTFNDRLPFPVQSRRNVAVLPESSEDKIFVLDEKPISNPELIRYLGKRGIDLTVAGKYCCQVRYEFKGIIYQGIGFKNNAGGYDIRSQNYKKANMPKDITTIDNGPNKEVLVFEGFFDFLTFMTIHKDKPVELKNYVILNGTALFARALEFMDRHERVRLFVDNDNGGQKCVNEVLEIDAIKYYDERAVFAPFNDLNDWHVDKIEAQAKVIEIRSRPRLAIAK